MGRGKIERMAGEEVEGGEQRESHQAEADRKRRTALVVFCCEH